MSKPSSTNRNDVCRLDRAGLLSAGEFDGTELYKGFD